jgi:hypothetical protein
LGRDDVHEQPAQSWPGAVAGFRPPRRHVRGATGTWSVAYTLFGPPSSGAWGNLNAQLYTGASQCADYQAQIASFQESPTLPGDPAISGIVLPPPDRMVRAAESLAKTFDGNTITLTMRDPSLVGATPTCVAGGISHAVSSTRSDRSRFRVPRRRLDRTPRSLRSRFAAPT